MEKIWLRPLWDPKVSKYPICHLIIQLLRFKLISQFFLIPIPCHTRHKHIHLRLNFCYIKINVSMNKKKTEKLFFLLVFKNKKLIPWDEILWWHTYNFVFRLHFLIQIECLSILLRWNLLVLFARESTWHYFAFYLSWLR